MSHLQIVPKVVPIRSEEMTRKRLIEAVGKVMARDGFEGLGVNQVAREAGVDKKLIYRYFHGLTELVAAYGRTVEFWPPACELLGPDANRLRSLPPDQVMSLFFKRYMRAILARPQTLEILAWEAMERNDLTRQLEPVRAQSALEFFEYMDQDPPEDVDLTALVLLMYGAVNFLAVRSRKHLSLGGVDVSSEEGWARVDACIDQVMSKVLGGVVGGVDAAPEVEREEK